MTKQYCDWPDCEIQSEHYHCDQIKPDVPCVNLPYAVVVALERLRSAGEPETAGPAVPTAEGRGASLLPMQRQIDSVSGSLGKLPPLERANFERWVEFELGWTSKELCGEYAYQGGLLWAAWSARAGLAYV